MTTEKPKLSVGMPVYNGEKFLHAALDSIVSQSFEDFELIICDNGSTDSTAQICNSYATSDSRLKFSLNAENLGATANYNAVATKASGVYFKWASSNDICQPGFFQSCVDILDQHEDVILCYPKTRLFDEDNDTIDDYDDFLHIMDDDPVERFTKVIDNIRLNNVMNGMTRTKALQATKLIPDVYCGDQSVIVELALMGKIYELPEFLFYRRMDKTSATHMKDAHEVHLHFDPSGKSSMLFQRWKLFHIFYDDVKRSQLSDVDKRRLYRKLATRMRWKRHILGGDFTEAARWYWRKWRS